MTVEEILKEAVKDSFRQDMEKLEEETRHIDATPNKTFKRKLNRLFRERVGTNKIPHPEVDNAYERVRSCFIRMWFVLVRYIKKKK